MAQAAPVTGSGSISLASYEPVYHDQLVWLLSILPRIYPNGDRWLDKKLNDIIKRRKGRCTLAVTPSGLVLGVAIETPKGRKATKLSTLFVHESFRGRGIGSFLMDAAQSRWLEWGLERVHATLDPKTATSAVPQLESAGFKFETIEKDRYGDGRDESVYVWTPGTASAAITEAREPHAG